MYCIVSYRIVLYCIVLDRIVSYCIVLHCVVSYCIALYFIVLSCSLLYCLAAVVIFEWLLHTAWWNVCVLPGLIVHFLLFGVNSAVATGLATCDCGCWAGPASI